MSLAKDPFEREVFPAAQALIALILLLVRLHRILFNISIPLNGRRQQRWQVALALILRNIDHIHMLHGTLRHTRFRCMCTFHE